MTMRIAVRACTRMMQYVWRNLIEFVNDFLSSEKKLTALQNGVHQRGWLGQMLRGRLGHVVGYVFIYTIIIMH